MATAIYFDADGAVVKTVIAETFLAHDNPGMKRIIMDSPAPAKNLNGRAFDPELAKLVATDEKLDARIKDAIAQKAAEYAAIDLLRRKRAVYIFDDYITETGEKEPTSEKYEAWLGTKTLPDSR